MQRFRELFLTMVAMGLTSFLLLLVIGIMTYFFKWQADSVMLFLTFVYILTGVVGGMVHRKLCPQKEKYNELFQKIGWGLLVGSLYMLILQIISIAGLKNNTVDIGRVFLIWFLIAGSAAIGELMVKRAEDGKIA
uniref:TIGR04086 family membrane protein n=1 Tax=Agathobacter sp. TaxID=2021311 RepID=UPI004055FEE7